MSAVSIVVVDDHRLIVNGLQALFAGDPEVEIVGVAGTAAAGLASAAALRPDVVLMDIGLPDTSGIEATRQLVAADPEARVVILTMYDDDEYVLQAVRSGARGYVLKSGDPEELRTAIRVVAAGGLHFPGALGDVLVRDYVAGSRAARSTTLTPREREVLVLIARGFLNKEIAQTLALSVRTVETYRERAMKKLGLHSVADLTRYAIAEGLLRID